MSSIYKLKSFDDLLSISEKLYDDGYCYEYAPHLYPTHQDFINKVKADMEYQLSDMQIVYPGVKVVDVIYLNADTKTHAITNIQIKGFNICRTRYTI